MALGAASGAGLVLAFPPFEWAGLVWVALVPLLWFLERCTFRAALAAGLAAGLVFHGILPAWIAAIGPANPGNYGLAAAWSALYPTAFAGLAWLWLRRLPGFAPFLIPATWVALEWLRSHVGFLAMPWGVLGYTQFQVLPVASLASWASVYAVSFAIVAANGLLAGLLRPRAPRALIAGGFATLLLLVAAANWSRPAPPDSTLRVGLVQSGEVWTGEPGPEVRARLLERQATLTRQAAQDGALLVAWPSGSVPGSVSLDRDLRVGLSLLAHETGTWLMVGSSAQQKLRGEEEPLAEPANSAWLYSARGRLAGRYDKRRLLPFDEYVPWRGVAPWPPWIVDPDTADFAAGEAPGVFSRGEQRFGVLICWENFFAESFRETAAAGVDFVLSLTNEAFTDSAAGHRQMLAMNVFRAVENRVSIARVAPTGISAVIAPDGAILESLQGVGVLVGELPTLRERSFFTRYGLWFVHLCGLANLAALAAAARPASLRSAARTARIEQ